MSYKSCNDDPNYSITKKYYSYTIPITGGVYDFGGNSVNNITTLTATNLDATNYRIGETVTFKDLWIETNSDQTDLTGSSTGLQFDRASGLTAYKIGFWEDTDDIKAGISGSELPITIRNETTSMTDAKYTIWDATNKRINTATYGDTEIGGIKSKTDLISISDTLNVTGASSINQGLLTSSRPTFAGLNIPIGGTIGTPTDTDLITMNDNLLTVTTASDTGIKLQRSDYPTMYANFYVNQYGNLIIEASGTVLQTTDTLTVNSSNTQLSLQYAWNLKTDFSVNAQGNLQITPQTGLLTISDTVGASGLQVDNASTLTINSGTTPVIRVGVDTGLQSSGLTSDIAFGTPSGGAFMQLNAIGGAPYIDFTRNASTDYDARLVLFENSSLRIDGASLYMGTSFGLVSDHIQEYTTGAGVNINSGVTIKDTLGTSADPDTITLTAQNVAIAADSSLTNYKYRGDVTNGFLFTSNNGLIELASIDTTGNLSASSLTSSSLTSTGIIDVNNVVRVGADTALQTATTTKNVYIGVDNSTGGNAMIQINSPSGSPYIDFCNTSAYDYNARLILSDASHIRLDGAHLSFGGGGYGIDMGTIVTAFSTDGTLVGNSDLTVPTEKAVKTYVDAVSAAANKYGEMIITTTQANQSMTTSFAVLNNFSTGANSGFTFASNALTATSQTTAIIDVMLNFEVSLASTIEFDIFIDGVAQNRGVLNTSAANDKVNVTMRERVTINASSVVDIRVKYNVGGGSITMHRANVLIAQH